MIEATRQICRSSAPTSLSDENRHTAVNVLAYEAKKSNPAMPYHQNSSKDKRQGNRHDHQSQTTLNKSHVALPDRSFTIEVNVVEEAGKDVRHDGGTSGAYEGQEYAQITHCDGKQ